MDWGRFCVHNRVVASGNPRDPVHGMPFAACWRWIENVSAVTHDHTPTLT